jgi:hypothetical protein
MSKLEDSLVELRVALETFFEARNIKIKKRNQDFSPDPSDKWVRLTFLPVSSKPTELGRLRIRDRGILVIDLMWPKGQGSGDVDALAIEARDTFSEYSYNSLELGVGSAPRDVPTTTDFFHVTVNIPYRHQ